LKLGARQHMFGVERPQLTLKSRRAMLRALRTEEGTA
jgi:hypothetical protein